MGVWNATCGVSSLPIQAGLVRTFLVAWHPPTFHEDDVSSEPTSLATPISLPVDGEYDGSGAVDHIVEGPLERRLLMHLRGLHARGDLLLSGGDAFPDSLEEVLRSVAQGRATAKVFPRCGWNLFPGT